MKEMSAVKRHARHFMLIPFSCRRCGKTMWWHHYYVYMVWKSEEPWHETVAVRWCVCEDCYDEYAEYYRNKYRVYLEENRKGNTL